MFYSFIVRLRVRARKFSHLPILELLAQCQGTYSLYKWIIFAILFVCYLELKKIFLWKLAVTDNWFSPI